MRPEQENFEQLRRLLALKRHEQPPPGYFNQFSRQVIARIRAGESAAGDSLLERLFGRLPWAQQLSGGFEVKPLVAGAFGLGVCSLLVIGLVSSERVDSNAVDFTSGDKAPQASFASVASQAIGSSMFYRAAADHSITGGVYGAQSRSSIFEEIQRPHAQPASYFVPAN